MRFSLFVFLAAISFLVACPSSPAQDPTPGLSQVPELEEGYKLLYEQKFADAREVFHKWAAANPNQPFGQVSLAASYLFEEFFVQRILTSEYFLNDKRFTGGIEGTPDKERIANFDASIVKARQLAVGRLKKHPRDPEGLFALTLCAGMQSDADSMLLRKHLDALKHLKEANSNAELLLAHNPDAFDAYVAQGVANYVIGSLSSSARFMLWFGGIHGDRALGMTEVQKTADEGNYLKPFAKILLALSARREKNEELARKNLKELTEEFPGNSVYDAEYAKAMGRPIPAVLVPAN
jgi:tetratricopeptide (TPR) repeat protein